VIILSRGSPFNLHSPLPVVSSLVLSEDETGSVLGGGGGGGTGLVDY
jgi:hypothetical protein